MPRIGIGILAALLLFIVAARYVTRATEDLQQSGTFVERTHAASGSFREFPGLGWVKPSHIVSPSMRKTPSSSS